jgi:hypothetical protein
VALLIALAFSAFFIGCIDPLVVEIDTDTYTEFELTGFNAVGGNAENQAGWATDGLASSGDITVKGDIGLTVEKLQSARYLVVEVNDGYPKNNFETIWGSWNAAGDQLGNWQQFSNITSGSGGAPNPGMGTMDGNIMKLDMSKILKNYPLFRDANTASMFLLIQHWGNGGTGACIKSAKLLIPDVVEPPPPPEPPLFEGKGSYVVPAAISAYNTSFYVDLNEVKDANGVSGGNPGGLKKIEEGKITVGFTKSQQVFYIPFTADQAAFVKNASERGFTVDVTINGSYPADGLFRWTFSNGTGASWATYTLFTQANTTFGTATTLTSFGNQNRDPKGFLFQARNAAGNDSSDLTTTLVINSILVEVTGSPALTASEITELEFTVDFGYDGIDGPYAGATAPTEVKAVTGAGYEGALTWTPALTGGKFAPLELYTASIVVTPKLGNYFGIVTSATLNTEDGIFNPASRTLTYTFPDFTGADSDPLKRPEYSGTELVVSALTPAGVATTPTASTVSARNGNIAFKADDSGFIFRSLGAGGGYQEEYPKFKVNVGALVAGSRIRFKYKGIEGDVGWKNVGIAICTAEPTGDVNITSLGPVKNGTPPSGDAIGNVVWNDSYANSGLEEMEFTATLEDAVAAGDIWVVITMHGGKRKAFEVYDIRFLPPPPTFVNVKVGAATQEVVPVGVGATVEMLDGSIGFIHKRPDSDAGDYQNSYIYFPVNLGTDKTIADFASVNATIEATGGTDTNYKKAAVFVKGVAFTGEITAAMRAYLSTGYGGTLGYSNGVNDNEWPVTIPATNECAFYADDTATGNNVFICIYIHAPKGQTYTITNIELVPNP